MMHYKCPCCFSSSTLLGDYLSHNCTCKYTPCRLMDIFDNPISQKKQEIQSESVLNSSDKLNISRQSTSNADSSSDKRTNQQTFQSQDSSAIPQNQNVVNFSPPIKVAGPSLSDLYSANLMQEDNEEKSQAENNLNEIPIIDLSSDEEINFEVIELDSEDESMESNNTPIDSTVQNLSQNSPLDLRINSKQVTVSENSNHNESITPVYIQNPSNLNEITTSVSIQNHSEPQGIENVTDNNQNSSTQSAETNTKNGKFICIRCKKVYKVKKRYENHLLFCGQVPNILNPATFPSHLRGFKLISTAFKGHFLNYQMGNINSTDTISLVTNCLHDMIHIINTCIDELGSIKLEIVLTIEMDKLSAENLNCESFKFSSCLVPILAGDDKKEIIMNSFKDIDEIIAQFTEKGSGWSIKNINTVDLLIGKYKPHRGGCVNHKLPTKLQNKKCLISPQCSTDCFMYSILISLHGNGFEHPARTLNYNRFINRYKFEDVRGIVELTSIGKFEYKNKINVNVYSYNLDGKYVIPLRISKSSHELTVNLFLYEEHYYSISSFTRLVNCNATRDRFVCYRCLTKFRQAIDCENHLKDCGQHKPQKLVLPTFGSPGSILKRKDFKKELRHPFVIYADFETLCHKNNNNTNLLQDLKICSFGYVAVSWEGKIIAHDFQRGEEMGQMFFESLKKTRVLLKDYFKKHQKKLIMTAQDEEKFKNAQHCHICELSLGSERVRDHDHLTGAFRGAAHQSCNLDYQVPSRIPIIFHNLKNFDGHIIIQALKSNMFEKRPQLVPLSMEKYLGFYIEDLAFLDSYAFLPASLDNLASNLSHTAKEHFISQLFENTHLKLLLKKGCLPYEYIDSLNRFDETLLPPKAEFYSSLTGEDITDEKYELVKKIWTKFECKNLGDLHDIYLKVDVLLLTSVFENFRNISLNHFKIDPCHYLSSPGLTWAAAIKKTKIEMELFTDVNMLLMVEKGIRGGLTTVSKRYCKANNKDLPDYNSDSPTNYIMYFDVNNLYGYAMSDYLPVDNFEWCTITDEFLENVLNCADNGDKGYILEVDLEYPPELHNHHNDYPLAPNQMQIDRNMLSSYQSRLVDKLNSEGYSYGKSKKLVASLLHKKNYVIHYKSLKYYVSKGLKVTHIHRAISFNQKPWLADYVNFCTEMRQKATSDDEKDFWKLMVNSVYGKAIEDKRKRVRVDLVQDDIDAERHMRKNHIQRFQILSEDKVLFQMKQLQVKMDKPIVIGFTVLELAKLKMFKIHYDNFKAFYDDKIELLYTDTDSLIYNIKTNSIYDDMLNFKQLMDYSNYPKDHPLYDASNCKKIGYLKDEMGGKQISEIVAIKPKLYALKTNDDKEIKKAKGVQKAIIKKSVNFDSYKTCLNNEDILTREQFRLGSINHQLHLIKVKKIIMTPLDDKRYLLPDKISSLAYGHYKINE